MAFLFGMRFMYFLQLVYVDLKRERKARKVYAKDAMKIFAFIAARGALCAPAFTHNFRQLDEYAPRQTIE